MKFSVLNESSYWGRTSYIVADGGRAIALVTVVESNKSVAILHDLVVHESRRNRGIGTRILKEAEKVAWELGTNILRLSVEPCSWMEGWYERNGFQQAGVQVFDGHASTIMEKDITRRESAEPQSVIISQKSV